jgi:regulator of nucleoside diphosphate kinase
MNIGESPDLASSAISLTARDADRLAALIEDARSADAGAVHLLGRELRRAWIVPATDIRAGTITMHSLVRCRDEDRGEIFHVMLVYPDEAASPCERVSGLSPLGIALVGLSEGQSADYEAPEGGRRRFAVLKVLLQPEASRVEQL